MIYHVNPFVWFASLCHEFQITDEFPNHRRALMAIDQARKYLLLPLPILCQGLESDVLRKEHAAKLRGTQEELIVRQLRCAILVGGQDVDAPATELVANRSRDVVVEIQGNRHRNLQLGGDFSG
jgi:hypothetical protein